MCPKTKAKGSIVHLSSVFVRVNSAGEALQGDVWARDRTAKQALRAAQRVFPRFSVALVVSPIMMQTSVGTTSKDCGALTFFTRLPINPNPYSTFLWGAVRLARNLDVYLQSGKHWLAGPC